MNSDAKTLYAVLALMFCCAVAGFILICRKERRAAYGRLTRQERAAFDQIAARWDDAGLAVLDDEGDSR